MAAPPDKPDRTPLELFVELHGAEGLAVLVSGKAEGDVSQALTRANLQRRPSLIRANFTNPDSVLAAARQAARDGFAGLAIARGGGVALEELGNSSAVAKGLIELGLPFYSALGHGDDVSLLDKYSDQSFPTPTELAAALGRAEERVALFAALQSRADRLTSDLERSEVARVKAEAEGQELASKLNRTVYATRRGIVLSWRAAAAVLIAAAVGTGGGVIWLVTQRLPDREPELASVRADGTSGTEESAPRKEKSARTDGRSVHSKETR
ncbi:hypothetical protein DJ018_15375 [Phenylobacterium deserti]|uniref:Exonuclease VII large subunit C-terminal domain-containing protein n=2 Tax=Phenylobacterium deserti TaxID=1914756 RepID=A0A328AAV1_9CAUL|nr:hypothetical protein DJ018_15375 [Phenylobacterium deserti]